MHRILLLALVITFIASETQAQKNIDVVYLKNGGLIKGKILENTGESLKIETCCGNIFAYKQEEISQIASEKYINDKVLAGKGYFNLTSMGVLIGSGENEKQAPLSLLVENNYRFNNYFAAGGVVGLEFLNETTLPLALDLKAMLPLNKGTTLYIAATGGYSVSLDKPEDYYYVINKAKGGILFNSEIGFISSSGSNARFFMAVGYRYSELNYERENWQGGDNIDRKVHYNRFSFRLGLCFN